MTIQAALQCATETLQSAGIPDPKTDAGLIMAHVTGIPRLTLLLHSATHLTTSQEQHLSSLLVSRTSRKPLQYVLSEQCFYGLPFFVDERVLVPRPETEMLCELAIRHLQSITAPHVLDLCTGSGAIAVTLAHECSNAHVTASDISQPALSVAQTNAAQNHVQVRFLQGDLFAPFSAERFHCITCNPPYIESAACFTLQEEVLHEPVLALDGGEDGLDFYRRIASQAAKHLYPGGLLCLEIGDTQADAVSALLSHAGHYENIVVHKDLSGSPRVVCASASPP